MELSERLKIVPGKKVLSILNTKLQELCLPSITTALIRKQMEAKDLSTDMNDLLDTLGEFCLEN